ncbi:MAG TPA: DUF1761 domain-containing protein [Terracidiphilus sp.]|jgi:hypothetical protein
MHHLHFNYLAVLVSAFYQWILGAFWYSLFFVKPWMALTGHIPGSRPKSAVVGMVSSFIVSLILTFILAHVVKWSGADCIAMGLFIGFICWLGFVVPPIFSETIYEQRSFKLLAINSGYWLCALLGSGALLAVWQ